MIDSLKVCIGIPTYNQKEYIFEAVESALKQDYQNIEIIISDDNSTDGSYELLVEKYKENSKIKINRNSPNVGRVKNYRKLLYELSDGDYYLNLDGDDYFLDDQFVSRAMQDIQAHGSLVPYIAITTSNENEKNEYDSQAKYYSPNEFLLKQISKDGFRFGHASILTPVKSAQENNYYNLDIFGIDTTSFMRLVLNFGALYRPNKVAFWRVGHNHTSGNGSYLDFLENTAYLDDFVENARFIPLSIKLKWLLFQFPLAYRTVFSISNKKLFNYLDVSSKMVKHFFRLTFAVI